VDVEVQQCARSPYHGGVVTNSQGDPLSGRSHRSGSISQGDRVGAAGRLRP
jgi:hypothetical protein